MFRKERTHLFWAGNGGRDRGNIFQAVLLCLESSLTFFVWHWHLGSLPVLGTGPGVWVWEMVMAGKNFMWHWLGVTASVGDRAGCGHRKWWWPENVFCFLKKFFTICHQGHTIFGLPNHLFWYPHEDWLGVTK